MIFSMTSFAKQTISHRVGLGVWELRALNQRYLEVICRLPDPFRELEPLVRERLRAAITRGKVECTLRFELDPAVQGALQLNQNLAQQLIESAQWINKHSDAGAINAVDILRWPGVVAIAEVDLEQVSPTLLSAFDQALQQFISVREREGAALQMLIEQRLAAVDQQIAIIRNQMPQVVSWQRDKLRDKLKQIELQLNIERLEQELVLLAQRVDVSEELDRLTLHVQETRSILQRPGAMGRRLDFMMQELNREANTLASKSINSQVTLAAVELKLLIEQMREQIQNIE